MTECDQPECARVPMWMDAGGHRSLWSRHEAEMRRSVGEDGASLERESAADVVREFGRESQSENGDRLLLLHRERPLEALPSA